MALGDVRDGADEFGGRGVQAAFALHSLQHDGGGGVDAARIVRQHLVQQGRAVQPVGIAVERHAGHALRLHPGAAAVVSVAGRGQRAHRHAMKAVGEGHDIGTAGRLAGDLHRRLDRVGTGGAGEHHAMIHAARRQDVTFEGVKEGRLGRGMQVQPVGDPVTRDVVDQRGLHVRIIVTIVQRRAAGQKVDVVASVRPGHHRAAGLGEDRGNPPAIGSGRAFAAFEDGGSGHGGGHVFGHGKSFRIMCVSLNASTGKGIRRRGPDRRDGAG